MTHTERTVLIVFAALAFVALLATVVGRSARALYPELWARRWPRRALFAGLATWGALMAVQPFMRTLELPRDLRVVLMSLGGVTTVMILLTLPFLGLGVWVRRRAERGLRSSRAGEVAAQSASTTVTAPEVTPAIVSAPTAPTIGPIPALSRRELAITAAKLAPVGGAALSALGARGGRDVAELVELKMAYPELAPDLEGLRILQLSDVHLGSFIDLDEVASLVEQSAKAKADLVVLTGDVADDLSLLPDALAMFDDLKPRLGVYASIGNHEYFRGIREARRAYEKSNVPLLLERGHTVRVGSSRIHISGADDPRYLRRQSGEFFKRTVATTLDGAPSDAFHVLMSHRPEGFVAAREAGVHLTLAGHTHGAQVGIGGRSILEPLLPEMYLWGAYQEGAARLYTSSGAGHWFPFRLGCPREVAVFELVRGPAGEPTKKRIA